jgi:DNA-directed RNA polymerase specialized sigma24 family protein
VTEPGFGAVDDAYTLSRLMDGLDERTREILRLRFEQDLTRSEIGERVGRSQMHVSRLIREACGKWLSLHHDHSGYEESRRLPPSDDRPHRPPGADL